MTAVTDAPAAPDTGAPPADPGLEKAQQWADEYVARIGERTASRLAQLAHPNGSNGAAKPAIGEPTVNGVYVAFDIAATSPIQFTGLPPYQPSKVIAAGEAAFLVAIMFVNPTPSVPNGFAVPPAVQLGGRTWRASLDLMNVTTGSTVILAQQGVFGTPANPPFGLLAVVFALPTPDPGKDPDVYEANVTLDIVDPGQPYAAFATNFLDEDTDPGFFFVPPDPPGWRHELPNRYLVYRK